MERFLIATFVFLGGCSSYADRQATEPIHSAASSKAPDDYIACAAPKILTARGTARVIPDGSSRVIVIGGSIITGVTLTASPASGGSEVALRMVIPSAFPEAWPLAQSCL